MKVHISCRGNRKLGKTASFSFPPVISCRPDAPCVRQCYARRHCNLAWKYWEENWEMVVKQGNIEALYNTIRRLPPSIHYFRWFIGGDIPSVNFLDVIIDIAKRNPSLCFMMYTKRYEWVLPLGSVPGNLTFILSAWPGFPLPRQERFAVAWMQDGTETRIPPRALVCRSKCEKCRACWGLRGAENVVFHKH